MYSFLKDGEFIQITIEEKGAVSGFISRFGDSGSDKGSFLDQFFKSGQLDGNKVTFTTENVHGVWFTFDGNFERGPGKKLEDDAYFVVRGMLTRFSPMRKRRPFLRSGKWNSSHFRAILRLRSNRHFKRM